MKNLLEQMFDDLADDITSTMNAPEGAHKTVRAIVGKYKKTYAVRPMDSETANGRRDLKSQRPTTADGGQTDDK